MDSGFRFYYTKKAERIGKRFCEFLQVEKDCGTGTGCMTDGVINIKPSENHFNPQMVYKSYIKYFKKIISLELKHKNQV